MEGGGGGRHALPGRPGGMKGCLPPANFCTWTRQERRVRRKQRGEMKLPRAGQPGWAHRGVSTARRERHAVPLAKETARRRLILDVEQANCATEGRRVVSRPVASRFQGSSL